jgi:tetratricopeptide (TPR) repeat protein
MKQMRRFITLIACLLLSFHAVADDEGKEWLRKADAHYKAGRYDIAVGYYLKAAEFDETEAQFNLGYALYNGEGIKQDYPSAVMWFKRAASKQYPKAEYNLAFCYMYGKGVPCDYEKAQQLLIASANHGFADAQITLSECYENGILVEKNMEESKRWKSIAENGSFTQTTEVTEDLLSATATYDVHLDGVLRERSTLDKLRNLLYTEVERSTSSSYSRAPIVLTPSGKQGVNKAPVLNILFPTDQSSFHTDMVKVKYQLLASGLESSTKLFVSVNGIRKQLDITPSAEQTNTVEIDVPEKDCTITLFAENEGGSCQSNTVKLIREDIDMNSPARLFCVSVGVGSSSKSARDFARVVTKKQGSPYAEIQMKVLTDKEATRADLAEAMEWLQQETRPNDICLFYYAGNGFRDVKDHFYFIPYGGADDKLINCLNAKDFATMTSHINCKLLVFADVICTVDPVNHISTTTHFAEQLKSSKKNMVIYASSTDEMKAGLFKTNNFFIKTNSVFTKTLISAFNDGDRQPNEKGLSTKSLGNFILKEVQRNGGSAQIPAYICPPGMEPFNIFTYDN